MGRVIVHIGTHKTGTTSIQKTLAGNRDLLSEYGILYPGYDLVGMKAHYAHLGMANALAGEHDKFTVQDAEHFFTCVRQQACDHKITIISAEPLYRQISGRVHPQFIPHAKQYWDARESFISHFRRQIGSAEIAIVVRRQDEFAESMYQEMIKVTRKPLNFAEFLQRFWFHFDYTAQINAWKKYFDTIHIIPFSQIKGGNITQNFLDKIGIDTPAIPDGDRQNTSIPHDGVILKRHLNAQSISNKTLIQISEALSRPEFRQQIAANKRSFFASEEHRNKFLALHAESNQILAEMAGRSLEDLFPSKDHHGLTYGDQLSPATRQELLDALLHCNPMLDFETNEVSIPPELPEHLLFDATEYTRQKNFQISLQSCRLDYTAAGDILVISFDNAGAPHRDRPDRKAWGHKFLIEQGYSVLGVIAGTSDWYRGEDLHHALLALREQGFFKSFRHVALIGSSMGGFAATAFASLAPGCTVVSFNPQSTLRRCLVPWDRSHPNGMKRPWSGLFHDGAVEVRAASLAYIFFDPFHQLDRRHAKRYQGDNIRLIKAPMLGHGLPHAYLELGLLKDIMRGGISGSLDEAWYYRELRKRRNLPKYYKSFIEPLIHRQRFTAGMAVMKRAFTTFRDPYFSTRAAVFAAAAGQVSTAMALLEKDEQATTRAKTKARRKNIDGNKPATPPNMPVKRTLSLRRIMRSVRRRLGK